MDIVVARIKMSIHKRVKRALKRLSVGDSGRKKGHKNPARSFHNFTSRKKVAKSDAAALRKSLMRCASNFQEDIIPDVLQPTDQHWSDTHWMVINFTAVGFLPEQVRRMSAVIMAVVGGRKTMEYIDKAFDIQHTVQTPMVSASAIWLDKVVLQSNAESYHQEMLHEDGHERLSSIRSDIRHFIQSDPSAKIFSDSQ